MNWGGAVVSLIMAVIFLWAQLEWLAFVFFVITVLVLVYPRAKKEAKKSWEDMKKADAFNPEAKFDGYVKGISKHASEHLIKKPVDSTEVNAKAWLHKTTNVAKNFFSELESLFK
jgi:hypothetical protein